MKPSRYVLLPLLASLAACESGGLVGNWEATQNGALTTLSFSEDSTFVMDTGGFRGEGTYSVDEDRNVVLTPTGPLATVMSGGFTGEMTDWTTLNLCAPTGTCADFRKVQE